MFLKLNIAIFILLFSDTAICKIETGLWVGLCQQGLAREQYIYNNQQVVLVEHFHQDTNCLDESFRFQTSGAISYYNEHPNYIDFIYEEIHLTIFKQNVIDDFNTRKACGYNDWIIGKPQNITGRKCAIFNLHKETQIPRKLDRRYGIFQIENNKLYYGQLSKDFDGSSSEKRPVGINKSTEYIFQSSF